MSESATRLRYFLCVVTTCETVLLQAKYARKYGGSRQGRKRFRPKRQNALLQYYVGGGVFRRGAHNGSARSKDGVCRRRGGKGKSNTE
ncbi:hypothetical protein F5B19DRAFT_114005 [Rostrohypoxylon terebratum]|nr:hypothetical protein F5B19DRAFT_114005 [Rostrohypoxylon terebratum]